MTGFQRRRWVVAGIAVLALALSACSSSKSSNGGGGGSSNKPVKLVWWNNADRPPGAPFWKTVAAEYHAAHPNVTVDVVEIQNETLRQKLQVALQGNNPPDLFQQWGGLEGATQFENGKLMDLTDSTKSWIGDIGASAAGWRTADGKQYGVPYTTGIVGFWYNKTLFSQAGISQPPATWDDLLADVQKLKAANIVPISIGGRDRWPDAFWYDYLALRMCSSDVIQQASVKFDFSDPCWTQAGDKVKQLLDAQPFQKSFLATPAQTGAGSSAGLLGNGKVAMELQGHWEGGVMQGLVPAGKQLGDKLGWFAFPTVPGGQGDPKAALGGGDGFSCSVKAPPECVDFLKYVVSPDVQKRWAGLAIGPPVQPTASSAVSDPILKQIVDFRSQTSFVRLYLDIAFGTTVGQALDDATAQQFAGAKTSTQVVKAIQEAAKNR